jgi:hypothetical protein
MAGAEDTRPVATRIAGIGRKTAPNRNPPQNRIRVLHQPATLIGFLSLQWLSCKTGQFQAYTDQWDTAEL